MTDRELLNLVDQLGTPRVLIVGDLILDRYVTGDVERISPEAPIPLLTAKSSEMRLGGAGNVAANLLAMEAEVEVVGIVGDDDRGETLLGQLEECGADASGVVRLAERPTTLKTRMLGGAQQILRVDWEDRRPLTGDAADQLIARVRERVGRAQALIVSDYGKGVMTSEVTQATIEAARAAGVPVLVDPKGTDYTRYRGATLVTPNRKEAEEALARDLSRLDDIPQAAADLIDLARLDAAVITLGPDGIFFRSTRAGDEPEGRVPALARSVYDVTGAGDTVIAHLALGIADGLGLGDAVRLANRAASIVVGRRGAASVSRHELRTLLGERRQGESPILKREELPALLAEWRAEGKRIAFTNGCFDIVHAGHVSYLRTARARADVLIVGVNDDASVTRLKGQGRPINPIEDRLAVLAALEMVDAVVAFGEDTPGALVEEITPDVLVKGQDWEGQGVVGREWVEKHGGEVFLAPLVPGRSTTRIAEQLARGTNADR